MKTSERIRDAVELIIEGPAVLLFELANEVAQLEEENALLQSIREAQANMIGKLFAEKQEPA